jgi:beta-glucosidase-like glycosyl hydrolase
MKTFENKELLTEEIKDVLTEMISSVKTNKKVTKKEKTPRFSGYHLFMKEHRVVVKTEQPDIKPQDLTSVVAKAWKDVPEEQKQELNARALRMKEEYNNLSDNNKSDSDSDKAESSKTAASKEKKPVAKKDKNTEKKKPASKKPASKKPASKKVVSPPSSDDEEDDKDSNVVIEDAESDIDI